MTQPTIILNKLSYSPDSFTTVLKQFFRDSLTVAKKWVSIQSLFRLGMTNYHQLNRFLINI